MAAPIVDRIARESAGKLIVLKVNSDEHPEASARAHVQGIPTFVIFRAGREVARQAGLPSAAALRGWVDRYAA